MTGCVIEKVKTPRAKGIELHLFIKAFVLSLGSALSNWGFWKRVLVSVSIIQEKEWTRVPRGQFTCPRTQAAREELGPTSSEPGASSRPQFPHLRLLPNPNFCSWVKPGPEPIQNESLMTASLRPGCMPGTALTTSELLIHSTL